MYIGQSNDIERRFKEHIYKKDLYIEQVIEEEGVDNFSFEIVEECPLEELDEKEKYYINYYNSYYEGYNRSLGGNGQTGENNSNAKITTEDVINIRQQYALHARTKDVYSLYKNKISYNYFMTIWEGKSWTNIMSEIYTKDNKEYYSKGATCGELSPMATFTNSEVIKIRERYVNETAKKIHEDYKDRCAYQTFNKCCGVILIKICQYIKNRKKNGLINEGCIDYLREGEYWCYWYALGKSILFYKSKI